MSEPERRAALGRLLDGLESLARRTRKGLLFPAVPTQEQPLHDMLCERGYLHGMAPSGTLLPIEWRSFEEYCATLTRRSRHLGGILRSERRRGREGGVVIRRVTPTAELGDAMYRLATEHYRYKNDEDLSFSVGYLMRLLPRLGDNVLVFEAERNGKRCAMVGVVISGTVGWVTFLGVDVADRPNDFTYFNIVYYTLADHAAAHGLTAVLLGNGAYDSKLRRGCQLVPMQFFCRPASLWRRGLLSMFFVLHRLWVARKLQ